MLSRFNDKAQRAIALAESLAFDFGHNSVGTEHLLLALLKIKDAKIKIILESYHVTANLFQEELIELFGQKQTQPFYMEYTLAMKTLIETAILYGKKRNEDRVSIDTLSICLLEMEENIALEMLKKANVPIKKVVEELKKQAKKQSELDGLPDLINLNAKALKNPPILIEREKELNLLIEALLRKQKPNAILIGEPGVGKTAIVEYLAHLLNTGNVPDELKEKTIYEIDISGIIAGTKYRGEFEDKLKKIIKKVKDDENALLFIDEIHNIIGAGGAEGAIDASNILKPYLSKGEIGCIGATTYDEYVKIFEKEKALERRFQVVKIEEPTLTQTLQILQGIKSQFETFHHLTISDEILKKIVNYCDLYVCDRYFPDKAIDVLDIASVRAKNKKQMQLEEKNIIDVIEDLFKVKIEKGNKALALKKSLNQILIGQNQAINTIIEQISYIEMGINDENRPLGVFLFVGPTGVGKTETAKQIALNYFGNKEKYIKLDMSEYSEPSSVTKLIGSPPGYVGYERQSLLVDHIRKNPHSVVVLDEVEKAHRDVLDIFLSVFDEGYFYESSKKRVDFKNTIIIMTSNLGFNEKMFHKNKIGYVDNQVTEDDIQSVVGNHFRPEFLNRIDCVVYFNLLDLNTCTQLAKDYLQEYAKKAHYEFSSLDELAKEIASQQEGKQYGARGLKRLAKKMLISKIKETEANKIKSKSV